MDQAEIARRFADDTPPTDQDRQARAAVRNLCRRLVDEIAARVPEGREQDLAIAQVEQAWWWSRAGMARGAASQAEA